jgi:hypothetical protein
MNSLTSALDGGEWLSSQLHASLALPQGKSPWYPLDRRLDGTQGRSGHRGEEKNSQFLPGFEPPIIQPLDQRYSDSTTTTTTTTTTTIHEVIH